ncbi:MAG TPA: CHY zinc finger protein [Candidatus Thermoplasmatota archaeon]|nr:CHY zinc finger protein [Candidatus Thermoplasmatota archaeon]
MAGAPTVVRGRTLDGQARCVHWGGPLDIVAFHFTCCEGWWPCSRCHSETQDHAIQPWPADRLDEPSVLCGACRATMTAPAYAASGSRCPSCGAGFNPACRPHWPLYFSLGASK